MTALFPCEYPYYRVFHRSLRSNIASWDVYVILIVYLGIMFLFSGLSGKIDVFMQLLIASEPSSAFR